MRAGWFDQQMQCFLVLDGEHAVLEGSDGVLGILVSAIGLKGPANRAYRVQISTLRGTLTSRL